MNLTDPVQKDEAILVAALIHDPRLLPRFDIFDTDNDFKLFPSRLILSAARRYHSQMVRKGKIAYAPSEAIDRLVRTAIAARKHAEPEKAKQWDSRLAGFHTFIDTIASWPIVTEPEFEDLFERQRQRSVDRVLRNGINEIIDDIQRGRVDVIEPKLKSLSMAANPRGSRYIVEYLSTGAPKVLDDLAKTKADPHASRILTPFPLLNSVTRGGRLGRLWLWAAYAKDGKTQGSKECVYHAATEQGRNAMIFTNEQSQSDVRTMMVIRHSHKFIEGGLHYEKLIDATLSAEEERVLRATIDDLTTNKNYGKIEYVLCPSGTTIGDVRGLIDSRNRKVRMEIAMVDHTMLFEPSQVIPYGNEQAKLAKVIKELKDLALDFDSGRGLWVIAPHQIKREGKEAADERGYYIPSDMGGTAETERSADVMVWLWRDSELRDRREMRMGVGINRWGRIEEKGWEVWERFESSALLAIEEDVPVGTP